ncbi:MAG: aminoacyl-tRNA hydrolase [bacterium]|nr:aminoacyl-tRNA hydrolase [bacterium]
MYLIVGLGNPGRKYQYTRHNVGFWFAEKLASQNKIRMWRSRFQGKYGKGRVSGTEIALLKPRTFMNLSGYSVYEAVKKLDVPLNRLLVISDEIALPAGKIRLKRKGSDGGHKGLRSIIGELGSDDFPRLRIGVGPVPGDIDAADFVLSQPGPDENNAIMDSLELACDGFKILLEKGIEPAMAHINN